MGTAKWMGPLVVTEDESSFVDRHRLGSADPYTTVFSKRVSQEVVDQIRGLIVSNQLRPGDRLPSERTLAASMGVGRVTIREAMRVLEANGLIEIRVGARGGAVVASPSLSRIEAALGELLYLASATQREIAAAIRALEIGIVPIVVDRITEQEIADLREMTISHRAMSRLGERGGDPSTTFHVQVAKCSHNRAIEALAHSLRRRQAAAGEIAHGSLPTARCDATQHDDVLDAIASGDEAFAKETMRAHLDPALETLALSKPNGRAATPERRFDSQGGRWSPR
jgi:GntR family transcriptional regulator, transcriptional repressor for pyruvate dehydrogenase complex